MKWGRGIAEPFVESILHPTDYSTESINAFHHALAIGLCRRTQLTILHAESTSENGSPGASVRMTLEGWRRLKPGSPRSAVFDELELIVKKVKMHKRNPLAATLEYLERSPHDLIVLATAGREGVSRWIRPSIAERIAAQSKTMTLFVAGGNDGIVVPATGRIKLRRMLVPVATHPPAHRAIANAVRLARLAPDQPVEVVLLHVGDETGMPALNLPEDNACQWQTLGRSGEVVEQIAATASEKECDLIVMTTAGHHGLLDSLRGSITEQVVRRAPCPLLAVPATE